MSKKIVLALGGNALGDDLAGQMQAVKVTAAAIVDLIAQGHQVVVTHGNGPQVGMINLAFEAAAKTAAHTPMLPLSVCVALSQGYIGYDLQNALREELLSRNMQVSVATLITQVEVDASDEAFSNPTKPIGSFFSKEEAEKLTHHGYMMKEDAGRGYRRVVASPKPVDIVEKETVKALMEAGQVVITVGGGGIPVVREGNHLRGVSAVIDKDWASAKLASMINADMLIVLTAVEKVAINFGKPNQQWLDRLTLSDVDKYIAEGHFAKGSMLPKVEAAAAFARSRSGRQALITVLSKAKEGIEGKGDTYPTLDRVALLADACKCSVECLVTGETDSSHEKTRFAQTDAPQGLDSAGEFIAVISRMSEEDRERLLSIIYTNGVASLLKLGDEQNVKLLQLPDSVKSGVLKLASAPDTAIRESLSSLAENAHTASVANKKAV